MPRTSRGAARTRRRRAWSRAEVADRETRRGPLRARTSPAPTARRRGRGARRSLPAGPSMRSTIWCSAPGPMSTTPTVSPSRSTVARSQSGADLEEAVRDEDRPNGRCRDSGRRSARTLSARSAGSAAVISSRSRTSGSAASARARSMMRSVGQRQVARDSRAGRRAGRRVGRPARGRHRRGWRVRRRLATRCRGPG